jgi:hypothetical protein
MNQNQLPPYIKMGAGFADIELKEPRTIGGVNTKTVRMREPCVSDQLAADEMNGSDAFKEISMMANLLEVAPDDVKSLPLAEYKRVQIAFKFFTI